MPLLSPQFFPSLIRAGSTIRHSNYQGMTRCGIVSNFFNLVYDHLFILFLRVRIMAYPWWMRKIRSKNSSQTFKQFCCWEFCSPWIQLICTFPLCLCAWVRFPRPPPLPLRRHAPQAHRIPGRKSTLTNLGSWKLTFWHGTLPGQVLEPGVVGRYGMSFNHNHALVFISGSRAGRFFFVGSFEKIVQGRFSPGWTLLGQTWAWGMTAT